MITTAQSRGAAGTAQHILPAAQYQRFDADVPDQLFRLDRGDARDLASYASQASRRLSPLFAEHFAAHAAAPYAPIYPSATLTSTR